MVQPRESDLVVATHGRGIWIVDDISPLRALTPEVMTKEATLLPGRAAIQYFERTGAGLKATRLSTDEIGQRMHRSLTTRKDDTFSVI